MKLAIVYFLVLWACATEIRPPKTPASMLAYRLDHARCMWTCPIGEEIHPPISSGEAAENPLADCCTDPFGEGWSSCAWNSSGRFMSKQELMDPARLQGCGGDGYPDCKP